MNDGCATIILHHFHSATIPTFMTQMQRPRSTLAMVRTVGARFVAQIFLSTTCRQFNWAGLPLNQQHWGGIETTGAAFKHTKRCVVATSRSRCQYQVKHGFLGSTCPQKAPMSPTDCTFRDTTFQLVKKCEPQIANSLVLYIARSSGCHKADSRSNVQRHICSGD
jgi:hypothetical protein